jgi:hypothetical protein
MVPAANFAGSIAHSASKRLLPGAWQATDLPNVGMALSRYRLVWYKVVGGWGLDGITVFPKGLPLAFNNARRILQHLQAQPVALPNTSVGSSTFGQVSSIYPGTNPRLIQFGLKFMC